MKERLRLVLIGGLGIAVGTAVTLLCLPITKMVLEYFGPPRVTLVNATGGEISGITISLGSAEREVSDLKHGQAVTVPITGRFTECSTHVSWTDSMGRHTESAEDYMESCGFYHSTVVLTPDGTATAVHEISASRQPVQRTR